MSDNQTINQAWVTPLSDAEKDEFDKNGYLILKNLMSPDEVKKVRDLLDAKIAKGPTKENLAMSETFRDYIEFMSTFVESGKLTEVDLNKLKFGKNIFAHLDVSTFTPDEMQEIGLRSQKVVAEVTAAFKSGEAMDAPVDDGAVRVANLANASADMAVTYTHPRILGAVQHVFGDSFKVNEVSSRSAAPGTGQQPLHYDVSDASIIEKKVRGVDKSDLVFVMWAIDDFDKENGATRIVPGSHNWKESPEDILTEEELLKPYPGEARAIMPAGSVLLFQSYAWHSGVKNVSDRPRRMVYNNFHKRQYSSLQNMEEFLSDERKSELSDVERYVLAV